MQKARRIAVLKIYGESDRHELEKPGGSSIHVFGIKETVVNCFDANVQEFLYFPSYSRPMVIEVTIVLLVDVHIRTFQSSDIPTNRTKAAESPKYPFW